MLPNIGSEQFVLGNTPDCRREGRDRAGELIGLALEIAGVLLMANLYTGMVPLR